jgi:hypothetical protein
MRWLAASAGCPLAAASRRIAAAGRRRCFEAGYFEPDRVREILPALEEAVAAKRAGVVSA